MAEQQLFTYQDAVEHLMDVFDIDDDITAKHRRNARRAVDQAYRDLSRKHRWAYFDRRMQVRTEANQTTGSIAYDHTGGTNEREVTLTGATWPSWARFGHIIIQNNRYKIESRVSSTVVTLTPDSNPGSDIAAGESYNLYRSLYPLGVRVRRCSPAVEIANSYYIEYLPPGKIPEYSVGWYTPQRPHHYTFRNDDDHLGAMSMEFQPPPSAERTYDFMAEVEPRAINTEKFSTGTVSITSGQKTVTLSGATFKDAHVGAVIRFSVDGTDEPTGPFGNPAGTDNPFTAQRIILSKDSDTTATVDETVASTLNGVKYTISDPLDIETGGMLNYLWRLAELYYLRNNRQDFGREERQEAEEMARQSLIEAMAADNRNRDMESISVSKDVPFYDLGDWAIVTNDGATSPV